MGQPPRPPSGDRSHLAVMRRTLFFSTVGRGTMSDGSISIDAPPRPRNGRFLGGLLLRRKQHHFRITIRMDRAAIFINFAFVQFDRLEADTAEKRFLSRHSVKPPQRFLESSSENIMGCDKSRFQENIVGH